MSAIQVVINFPEADKARFRELTENFVVPRETITEMLLKYWSYLSTAPGEADNELMSAVVEYMFEGGGSQLASEQQFEALAIEMRTTPTVVQDDLINQLYFRVRSVASKVIPLVETKVIAQIQQDPHLKYLGYVIPTAITVMPFGLAVSVSLDKEVGNMALAYPASTSHAPIPTLPTLPILPSDTSRWR